jgi:pilus assembly protein CpaB
LLLALVFGGFAAYMASGWLKSKTKQAQPVVQTSTTTPIIVAAKEISPGSAVVTEHLGVVDWPEDRVVPGSMKDKKQLEGRIARYPIFPGEVILENKLAPVGTKGGMAAIIKDDKRAVTVKVDEASGVAGFVKPDDRVDVMGTFKIKVKDASGEKTDDGYTNIILQNILIRATGQVIERKDGDKPTVVPTVTLEVTPEEGEKLVLAAKDGQISLALRSHAGQTLVSSQGVRTSEMIGEAAKPAFEPAPPPQEPLPPPKPPRAAVEIFRGTERESVSF